MLREELLQNIYMTGHALERKAKAKSTISSLQSNLSHAYYRPESTSFKSMVWISLVIYMVFVISWWNDLLFYKGYDSVVEAIKWLPDDGASIITLLIALGYNLIIHAIAYFLVPGALGTTLAVQYNRIKQKRYFEKNKQEILDKFENLRYDLQQRILEWEEELEASNDLLQETVLPEKYQTVDACIHFHDYLECDRVDTLQQAYNLYEQEMHQYRIEKEQKDYHEKSLANQEKSVQMQEKFYKEMNENIKSIGKETKKIRGKISDLEDEINYHRYY